jgi:polyphosphate kinase
MNQHPATHFISRELSWLEFNQRVLEEALDVRNPLLERVKFFSIVSSNLDEFFEVRVAGVKQQIESNIVERSMDGRTATETLRAIRERVKRMVDDQFECWRTDLVPKLAKESIRFLRPEELEGERRRGDPKFRASNTSLWGRRWAGERRISFCSINSIVNALQVIQQVQLRLQLNCQHAP